MTAHASRLVPFLLCLPLACGGPQQRAVKKPVAGGGAETLVRPAQVVAPRSDISGEIMGTLVVASLDTLLQQVAGYLQPHLPAAFRAMAQPDLLRPQLFKALRLAELEAAVDTSRPLAVAMADPKVYRGGALESFIFAIPVRDADALLGHLERNTEKHESTAWKDHIFGMGRRTIHLRLDGAWAFLASDENLLRGAQGVLLPLVSQPPTVAAGLEVKVDTIYGRYGAKLEQIVAALPQILKEPDAAILIRLATRWLGYAKGVQSIALTLALESSDIRSRVAITAKSSGGFQDYLKQLDGGALWGASYIPKESALLVLSRESEGQQFGAIDDGIGLLKSMLGVDDPTLSRWRDAARRSIKHLSGESAMGLWVTPDGGVGFGGAVRVRDAAAARQEMLATMKLFAKELVPRLQQQLLAKLGSKLPGLGISCRARPGGLRLGQVTADLFEVDVRWPRLKDREAQKKLAQVQKGLTKVLGPRLTFAFTTRGEVGLLAGGKDYRKRMASLLAGGAGVAPETISVHAGGKKAVLLIFLPLATLAESVLRVVDQVTTIPQGLREAVNKVLPGPGKDAPMVGLLHREGDRLVWEMSVSTELVGIVAKSVMLAVSAGARSPAP